MYKHASRNLQRRLKVIEARPSSAAYICEDDLIQSAANMGEAECEEERRKLLTEKSRIENELAGAKAVKDTRAAEALGHRLSNICSRLGMLKRRIHQLRSGDRMQAFCDATRAIVSPETLERIQELQERIYTERRGAAA